MAAASGSTGLSLWVDTADPTGYRRLVGDLEADVGVVGAGIAGLTAALALKRRGLTVAVLEAARIGSGVTGNTTGKVTSLHRLAYTGLAAGHGADAARAYGEANEAAVAHIAATVEAEGIDCGFRRVANYTFAEDDDSLRKVRAEAALAADLGLPATFTPDVPLPFPALGAVRFDGQAQMHAVKYLQGLARAVDGGGSHVFEETAVRALHDGSPAVVDTADGAVRAAHVVVATNFPFGDDGRFAARCTLHRSYICASPGSLPPGATFISAGEPMRSLLAVREAGTDYVLIGGEGHPVPGGGALERYARLAAYGRDMLGTGEPVYRWSTQDCMPVDGLPFAGPISPDAKGIQVITGLRKWGLTNGTAAALAVADTICELPKPWARLFDTNRPVQAARRPAPPAGSGRPGPAEVRSLAPGQGTVVDAGGEKLAVHADAAGTLHAISAVCTHLGCTVEFNAADSTWDCPCHGSRFSTDGTVIQGPATADLPTRPVPAEQGPADAGPSATPRL